MRVPETEVRRLVYALILSLLPALLPERSERTFAADESVLLIGDAYDVARERRAESVRAYTDALLRIVRECVKLGLEDEGAAILEKIARLHTPERNRDPWNSRGTAFPLGDPVSSVRESLPRPPLSDQAALPKEVRIRIDAEREALGRAPSRFEASGDRQHAVETIEESERRARRRFVRKLSRLANQCVEDGFPALGYEVVLWTLRFDPENGRLRKALRQKPWRDALTNEIRWYTPYDYLQAKSGKMDHPTFGWVTPDALRRLASGQAEFAGEWMSKQKVAKLRERWSGRWEHETEHFVVHTNADLEEAVGFGREIERFYSFVFRVWFDFYAFDDPVGATRLVISGGKSLGRKKLRLHYHRSRASYLWELENDPLLRAASRELTTMSGGFYWGQNGRAYFYAQPHGPDFTTVFHEVTHQILGETYPTGAHPPAWLVEGIAVFMEHPVVRGERGTERLQVGAQPPPGIRSSFGARSGSRGEVPKINAFLRSRGTNESFHTERRREHYATAGAIVHFFLLHRGGVHRRAFIRYAREAYQNDFHEDPTTIDTLYNYLGLTEDELQAEWKAFCRHPDLYDY